jgi:hypothetical protein
MSPTAASGFLVRLPAGGAVGLLLSGASSDPNPYVLLLACFVAAVFSERVWRKAYVNRTGIVGGPIR